jgi:hypothetical protein
MTAGYNGASNELSMGHADSSGGMNNGILNKSSSRPPLNSNVWPEELLEHWSRSGSGSLTPLTEPRNVCVENGHDYRPYSYPVHDPVSAAAMGLIPVEVIPIELDITTLYEIQDRRKEKSGSRKDIPPQVRSVCTRAFLRIERADKSTSVDALRIEPHNKRIGTGEIRR